jgi:pimeloyl-ACP methyl ester carboxylesterase
VAAADSRKDASRVSAPTLVVWGARDRLAPSDTRAHWLLALPNAEIHVIPNAGHVPMIETPDELAAVIRSFRSEGEN